MESKQVLKITQLMRRDYGIYGTRASPGMWSSLMKATCFILPDDQLNPQLHAAAAAASLDSWLLTWSSILPGLRLISPLPPRSTSRIPLQWRMLEQWQLAGKKKRSRPVDTKLTVQLDRSVGYSSWSARRVSSGRTFAVHVHVHRWNLGARTRRA